jgi:hypothetical protein
VAIGTSVSMSIMYFLIAADFAYGSSLVENGKIGFEEVFRYKILSPLCNDL